MQGRKSQEGPEYEGLCVPSYRDWQIPAPGVAGCLLWSNAWLVGVVGSSSSRAVRKLGWRSRQQVMLGAQTGGGWGSGNREGVWHVKDI